jgi:hypothetical protein
VCHVTAFRMHFHIQGSCTHTRSRSPPACLALSRFELHLPSIINTRLSFCLTQVTRVSHHPFCIHFCVQRSCTHNPSQLQVNNHTKTHNNCSAVLTHRMPVFTHILSSHSCDTNATSPILHALVCTMLPHPGLLTCGHTHSWYLRLCSCTSDSMSCD